MGRIERVESELQKEISNIINNDIKDPRIDGMVSILKVSTSKDLNLAKISVSVYGSKSPTDVIKALNNCAGYIRSALFPRLKIRTVPQLAFSIDDSIEYSFKISKVLESIKEKEKDQK